MSWPAETAVVRSIVCSVMLLAVGCASGPTNPKLLTSDQAAVALKSMSDVPITPTRSIMILGGYMDPGFAARAIEKAIRAGTSTETEIIAISFGDCISFAQCRQRVLHAVAQWKDREFDVIANSMGGLVARFLRWIRRSLSLAAFIQTRVILLFAFTHSSRFVRLTKVH